MSNLELPCTSNTSMLHRAVDTDEPIEPLLDYSFYYYLLTSIGLMMAQEGKTYLAHSTVRSPRLNS
jgi:hypothetical protein